MNLAVKHSPWLPYLFLPHLLEQGCKEGPFCLAPDSPLPLQVESALQGEKQEEKKFSNKLGPEKHGKLPQGLLNKRMKHYHLLDDVLDSNHVRCIFLGTHLFPVYNSKYRGTKFSIKGRLTTLKVGYKWKTLRTFKTPSFIPRYSFHSLTVYQQEIPFHNCSCSADVKLFVAMGFRQPQVNVDQKSLWSLRW